MTKPMTKQATRTPGPWITEEIVRNVVTAARESDQAKIDALIAALREIIFDLGDPMMGTKAQGLAALAVARAALKAAGASDALAAAKKE